MRFPLRRQTGQGPEPASSLDRAESKDSEAITASGETVGPPQSATPMMATAPGGRTPKVAEADLIQSQISLNPDT